MNNSRSSNVYYTGPGQLRSLNLYGLTANANGLWLGLIFDPQPFSGQPTLDNPLFWQQGFPFTTDAKSVTGKVQLGVERLAISVKPGTRSFSLGIDRDERSPPTACRWRQTRPPALVAGHVLVR